MSFKAYLNNVKAKAGKSAEQLQEIASEKGFIENGKLKPSVKAGEILEWLKTDFELGHGHAMSVYAYLKGKRE